MDFGPHTVQIFVSLMVVLAAAGVALICDLLKGNNEHLRELAVELKVRHEESERRAEFAEKRTRRIPDLSALKPMVEARPNMQLAEAMAPAQSIAVPAAAPQQRMAAEAPAARTARPERGRREMSPAVAAVAQAAAALARQDRPTAATAVAEQTTNQGAEELVRNVQTNTAGGGRKNWDSILRKTAPRQGALIPFESIREAVAAGYHDASVLQRAIESGKPVTGLVLSIGTNGLDATGSGEVAHLVQSLLGPQDFGCQSGSDEFIVVCAGEQGASAQRRLSAIAEKLWDFQLGSIGGAGVQFAWGSFEAHGERIGEAVGSAIEQMQETRHIRRTNIAKAV